MKRFRYWPDFFWLLPARFVHYCAIRVWSEATTRKYSATCVASLTMSEAIARFSRIHALGGSGSDEHYDSNRGFTLLEVIFALAIVTVMAMAIIGVL